MKPRDTMAARWGRLRPHVQMRGPAGRRPAVLLFHGCGGIMPQLHDYAAAAADAGLRAVIVDSYAPRGWSRAFGSAFVCTGTVFRGAERAGDVLAAAWGAAAELDCDPARLVLAGWSHGAWAIMDLATMPLERPGEAGLADPSPEPLAGLQGLFLGYPYGGVTALSRTRPWVRAPRTLGVIAEHDRVTRPRDSDRVFEAARTAGARLDIWRAPGAHCFDEPGTAFARMRYDKVLAAESVVRFKAFVEEALA